MSVRVISRPCSDRRFREEVKEEQKENCKERQKSACEEGNCAQAIKHTMVEWPGQLLLSSSFISPTRDCSLRKEPIIGGI